jgi:hypothetical protein
MPDTRRVKKIFNWKPLTKRYKEDPSTDGRITSNRTSPKRRFKKLDACVQVGGKWKEVVEKAKTFN